MMPHDDISPSTALIGRLRKVASLPLAAVVACASLSLPTTARALEPASDGRAVGDLYAEGQMLFADEHYAEAARIWLQVYRELTQSGSDPSTRRMVLLNIVSAFSEASVQNRTQADDYLNRATNLLETYVDSLGGQPPSPEVVEAKHNVHERIAELRAELEGMAAGGSAQGEQGEETSSGADANATAADAKRPPPPEAQQGQTSIEPGKLDKPGKLMLGLGIGSGVLALGAASFVVMGAIDLKWAEGDEVNSKKEVEAQKKYARTALITGASLTTVFLAAAGVLVVQGVMRKGGPPAETASAALGRPSLSLGRGRVGLTWSGRF